MYVCLSPSSSAKVGAAMSYVQKGVRVSVFVRVHVRSYASV